MNKLLEIMNCNKIEINVATLCVGFKLRYIVYEKFRDYSLVPLLDDSVIMEIIACNLFEPKGEFDFYNICNDIWSRLEDNQMSYEVSKWLFACLKNAQNTIDDSQELLQKISEIYDDFYYPPSMEHIIYYLPSTNGYDPTNYTTEEKRKRLLRLFNEYLIMLQAIIASKEPSIDICLDFFREV